MKEKFRLRCDINNITDIEDMDSVAEQIERFSHIQPYHRYSYLLRGYHDLVHGKIDDETFFTLGDITGEHKLFDTNHHAGLETIFALEDTIAANTLYIVEKSALYYYVAKVGEAHHAKFMKDMKGHGSDIISL